MILGNPLTCFLANLLMVLLIQLTWEYCVFWKCTVLLFVFHAFVFLIRYCCGKDFVLGCFYKYMLKSFMCFNTKEKTWSQKLVCNHVPKAYPFCCLFYSAYTGKF